MTQQATPFVLHVDDVPDDLRAWEEFVNGKGEVNIRVCHPEAVSESDLRRACVVLVDFKIEHWPARNELDQVGLKPSNGLALLPVLQEAAHALDPQTPRAFALYTAETVSIARGLSQQPHIVARAHNLEWVFYKRATTDQRYAAVVDLAKSVADLPKPWPEKSPEAGSSLRNWLGLNPDWPWCDFAWEAIQRCHPPIHEFAKHTNGVGVIRWLLHRILPYPTFLVDDSHLAARLRVEVQSLKASLIKVDSPFSETLSTARYQGHLFNVVGRRWWRAAVDEMVFSLVPEDPTNLTKLHEAIRKLDPDLKTLEAARLFPVIDHNFSASEVLATNEEVVQVAPDDWPPFAEPAWARKSDVNNDEVLRAIVVNPQTLQSH
ncbi:hypothetical protein [Variovorax sp. DXTD-1]|uniref:hypothetical protein n=1 Tax=Variovorax sp. DXTD-1 TaxID=2495592 RepID=UPI000F89068E|nr:hypothetical protein [Variovorax sp. DXTD-1]RST53359.1 hypothetical protein EJI00_03645 [Variovorax sp. DXTD-1]